MFRNVLHNRIAVLSLSGILAVGAMAGAGVAVASATGGGASTAASTTTTTTSTSDAPDTASPTATATMTTTQQCHAKFRFAEGLVKDIASKSGMDVKTIAADLKAGKTLNDILGSNASTVEQQVLADVQARIQQAQQSGQLTSAQATKLSQEAPDALSKFFSSVHTPGQHKNGSGSNVAAAGAKYGVTRASLLQTAATTIGIDASTLKSDIKSGQTIAQVAGDKTQAVITALQQQVDAAVQQAATNGKLTSAQASALTTKANQRITNIVNNGFHKAASGSNRGSCN